MRGGLKDIQLIEKYLMNQLNDAEKKAVEKRIHEDNEFRQEVEKQQLMTEAIERKALKASAKKGAKKFKTIKNIKYITTTILALGAAALIYYAVTNKNKTTNSPEELLPNQAFTLDNTQDTVIETENGMVLVIPESAFVNEAGETILDVNFEVREAFETSDILKAGLTTQSNGELLETGGMFFLNAYDKNGNKLKLANGKNILAEIPNNNPRPDMMLFDGEKQEDGTINWINPKPFEKDLITYDITTLDFYPEGYLEELKYKKTPVLDGKKLFEMSCGSCHRPTTDGTGPALKGVKEKWASKGDDIYKYIRNPQSQVEAGVPSALAINNYDPTVMPGQAIDKEEIDEIFEYLENSKFYHKKKPKTIQTSININNKNLTDSIYYSFARLFTNSNANNDEQYTINYYPGIDETSDIADTNNAYIHYPNTQAREDVYSCQPQGINPAIIQTIWNKNYNNTILATKEFEARLRVIHKVHNDNLLMVYINNLNKPLWYSDSIASSIANGVYKAQFKSFYQEKKGGVKVNDKLTAKLTEYFTRKKTQYTEQSSKLFNDYEAKKLALRREFATKKTNKDKEGYNRKNKTLLEEFNINMEEACQQLKGKKCTPNPIGGSLTGVITSLGPKNIDRLVWESTVNRETLDYTDPKTGKKVVIKYEKASVKILNSESFDRVFVYMIPDSLSSFNRMKTDDNINFSNTLNELFQYQLVCLAYKGEQAYFYKSNLSPKHYEVTLSKISDSELKQRLRKNVNGTPSKATDIISDINFYETEITFNKENEKYSVSDELTLRIGKFLFPELEDYCIIYAAE